MSSSQTPRFATRPRGSYLRNSVTGYYRTDTLCRSAVLSISFPWEPQGPSRACLLTYLLTHLVTDCVSFRALRYRFGEYCSMGAACVHRTHRITSIENKELAFFEKKTLLKRSTRCSKRASLGVLWNPHCCRPTFLPLQRQRISVLSQTSLPLRRLF